MAIANIIARGIGFSPGSVKFIVTHGFISGEAPGDAIDPNEQRRVRRVIGRSIDPRNDIKLVSRSSGRK